MYISITPLHACAQLPSHPQDLRAAATAPMVKISGQSTTIPGTRVPCPRHSARVYPPPQMLYTCLITHQLCALAAATLYNVPYARESALPPTHVSPYHFTCLTCTPSSSYCAHIVTPPSTHQLVAVTPPRVLGQLSEGTLYTPPSP